MKSFNVALFVGIISLFAAVYVLSPPGLTPEQLKVSTLKNVASELSYIRDERTSLCFAYLGKGTRYGGPALSMVPCETVKDFLWK